MIRVYYQYQELEEFQEGMWRIVRGLERKRYIRLSAELMKEPTIFYSAMCRAIYSWPKSCSHNLTVGSMNRIAWLGHAGCCVAVGSPEECTRAGWYHLTDSEMNEANRVAAEALSTWVPAEVGQLEFSYE